MKIAVFYHVYAVNNWDEIFTDQFNKMIKSGLISGADKVFINVGISENAYNYICNIAKNFNNIEVTFTKDNLFEYPTLKLLQDYCKENDCYVLYCHTKGVANQLHKENQKAMRLYFDYFNIECWNDAVAKLDEGFDCCGVNWLADLTPPCFSGNYWWANSNYINKLEILQVPDFSPDRTEADIHITQRCWFERWIGSGENVNAYALWQNQRAFYLTKIEESEYRKEFLPTIYLGSGMTKDYFIKSNPFLEGLNNMQNNIKKFVITLGWHIEEAEFDKYKNIEFIYQDIEYLKDELSGFNCVQYGAFVDVLNCNDDDIILFIDSDIVIQRDFTIDEISYLYSIKENEIAVNNNESGRTFSEEYLYLEPIKEYQDIKSYFGINEEQVYCGGVIASSKNTWQNFRLEYLKEIKYIESCFKHYAKIQFLISIIIQQKFILKVLPKEIHSHGCWQIPEYCTKKDGIVYADSIPLVFNHHFNHLGEIK